MPDESDRAVNVLLNFSDDELGLGAVHDGEDSVASIQKWLQKGRVDGFVT